MDQCGTRRSQHSSAAVKKVMCCEYRVFQTIGSQHKTYPARQSDEEQHCCAPKTTLHALTTPSLQATLMRPAGGHVLQLGQYNMPAPERHPQQPTDMLHNVRLLFEGKHRSQVGQRDSCGQIRLGCIICWTPVLGILTVLDTVVSHLSVESLKPAAAISSTSACRTRCSVRSGSTSCLLRAHKTAANLSTHIASAAR